MRWGPRVDPDSNPMVSKISLLLFQPSSLGGLTSLTYTNLALVRYWVAAVPLIAQKSTHWTRVFESQIKRASHFDRPWSVYLQGPRRNPEGRCHW